MIKEKISIYPEPKTSNEKGRIPLLSEPRVRFLKIAKNADHPLTVRMREIKTELRMTTAQLVKELFVYEQEFHNLTIDKNSKPPALPWSVVTTVSMSAYLQGWLVTEAYMSVMLDRLENLYRHKLKEGSQTVTDSARKIMNNWYKALGIDVNNPNISATRSLARMIAPFYKRPVLAKVSGTFGIGSSNDQLLHCFIKDAKDDVHWFYLNKNDQILFGDNKPLKKGDVLQYTVLMQAVKFVGGGVVSAGPSIDHSTFYRWYMNNKLPPTGTTIERVSEAVLQASMHINQNNKL